MFVEKETLERALVQGTVDRVFPDKNGHRHFEAQIGPQPTDVIELIYNISFGNLPAVIKVGDAVEACGDYITSIAQSGAYPPSPSGAIIHWVHESPKPAKHPSGFIMLDGTVFGQGHGGNGGG